MKRRGNNKKLLLGSFSIASAILIITGIIAPELIIYTVPQPKETKVSDLHDSWDIVVPDDYKTINEAIENAERNDRIYVKNGMYNINQRIFSNSLNINKEGIVLFGQDKNSTIINGNELKYPIEITANKVNISGFKMKYNGVNGSLLYLKSNNCNISNNIFEAKDFYDGTEYCIKLFKANKNIIEKNFLYNADKGIDFSISNENIIENNSIINNFIGIDIGSSLILNFSHRFSEMLYIDGSNNNIIKSNNITDNSRGIIVTKSDETNIINNKIVSNNRYGVIISGSENCIIKDNNLIDNGLEIWGNKLVEYIHDLKNNFVNNKPLYYYLKKANFDVPSDAGQIILVDCKNANIKNTLISNTSTAVLIAFSYDIEVVDNEFNSNYRGTYLAFSEKCSIRWNNFIKNLFDASFSVMGLKNRKTHTWKNNHWDNWLGNNIVIMRLTNKKIFGIMYFNRDFKIFTDLNFGLIIKNVDRTPSPNRHQIS